MQALDVGVEVRVHLDLVGVELQLRAVQQGLVGGEAGDDHVQHLDELDDVGHGAVGHGGGDVAGHGVLQGGLDVGLGQLLRPGALAVEDVAVALHHDVACAQHIGQLAHLLGVGDGLVEGLGEVVRAQDGQDSVLSKIADQLAIGEDPKDTPLTNDPSIWDNVKNAIVTLANASYDDIVNVVSSGKAFTIASLKVVMQVGWSETAESRQAVNNQMTVNNQMSGDW